MTARKRKKFSRQRGSHTHGYGSMKKHRGHGHKGGSGMAGTGKRADTKKPSIWKKHYFGKRGFKSLKSEIRAVNISFIEENLDKMLQEGKAKKRNELYEINLADIGFQKLLSRGIVLNRFRINAKYASKKAIDAIAKSGGEVILL